MMRYIVIILVFGLFLIRAPFVFAESFNVVYAQDRTMAMLEALRQNAMAKSLRENQRVYEGGEGILDFIGKRLHPYGSFEFRYDDNIYQLDHNIKRDGINEVNPGIKFVLGPENPYLSNENLLEFDVGGQIDTYFENHKSNRSNPYAKLNVLLGKGRHKLSFAQEYAFKSTLTSKISSGVAGTTDYIYNDSSVEWESVFHRFGFDISYDRQSYDYIGDFRFSSTSDIQVASFTAFLIPEAMPKTRFLFEYEHDATIYPKALTSNDNYKIDKFWAGVRGKITKKISGTAKIGYEWIRYKAQKKNWVAPVYADLTYQPSPRSAFFLFVNHDEGATSYVSEGNSEMLNISLSYRQDFSKRVNASTAFQFDKYKYGGGDTQIIFTAPVRLEYFFNKWLSSYLSYKYQKANSNQSYFRYTNNVFTAGAKAEF